MYFHKIFEDTRTVAQAENVALFSIALIYGLLSGAFV